MSKGGAPRPANYSDAPPEYREDEDARPGAQWAPEPQGGPSAAPPPPPPPPAQGLVMGQPMGQPSMMAPAYGQQQRPSLPEIEVFGKRFYDEATAAHFRKTFTFALGVSAVLFVWSSIDFFAGLGLMSTLITCGLAALLPVCVYSGVSPERGTQDCCFWLNIICTATCACCSFLAGLLFLLNASSSSKLSDEERKTDCKDDEEGGPTCYPFSSGIYIILMIVECVLMALYIRLTVLVSELKQSVSSMYQAQFGGHMGPMGAQAVVVQPQYPYGGQQPVLAQPVQAVHAQGQVVQAQPIAQAHAHGQVVQAQPVQAQVVHAQPAYAQQPPPPPRAGSL